MTKVTVYTTALCPYCYRAKRLLKEKGVDFEEIDVTFDPDRRREMAAKAGRASVPQIFVDGRHVGDCDGLFALEAAGRLDDALGVAA